jgi:hypothetical protein
MGAWVGCKSQRLWVDFILTRGVCRFKLIMYHICIKTMSVKGGVYVHEGYEASFCFLLCEYITSISFLFIYILLQRERGRERERERRTQEMGTMSPAALHLVKREEVCDGMGLDEGR